MVRPCARFCSGLATTHPQIMVMTADNMKYGKQLRFLLIFFLFIHYTLPHTLSLNENKKKGKSTFLFYSKSMLNKKWWHTPLQWANHARKRYHNEKEKKDPNVMLLVAISCNIYSNYVDIINDLLTYYLRSFILCWWACVRLICVRTFFFSHYRCCNIVCMHAAVFRLSTVYILFFLVFVQMWFVIYIVWFDFVNQWCFVSFFINIPKWVLFSVIISWYFFQPDNIPNILLLGTFSSANENWLHIFIMFILYFLPPWRI